MSAQSTTSERLSEASACTGRNQRHLIEEFQDGRDYLSLKLADPLATRLSTPTLLESRMERITSEVLRVIRLRIAPECPGRIERAGLVEDDQPRPRRTANKDRTNVCEHLAPGQ
jgi:hypothetical protein